MVEADGTARLIWIVLVLVVVLSSLFSRRLPLARLLPWSLGWIALFLGCYLLFTWFEPKLTAWQQSRRGGDVGAIDKPAMPSSASLAAATHGKSVSIPMSDDGHFWVVAMANGREVRFLVDSGASITAVSRTTADKLGLTIDPWRGPVIMQTANGAVEADRSSIAVVEIQSAIRASDLPVVVSAAFGDVNVLGMNFLNKLKSWRVEDGRMILEAR